MTTISQLPQGQLTDADGKPTVQFIAYLQSIEKNLNSTSTGLAAYSKKVREKTEVGDTTYTFALADSGGYFRFTNASPVSVTIPSNASVAFDIGTQIDVLQGGAGKVTFGGSVTINSLSGNKSLSGQYAGGTLVKSDTDTWDLVGSLAV